MSIELFHQFITSSGLSYITFYILDYTVEENNLITNSLYDTSECYTSADTTALIQFKLNVERNTVQQYGTGSFHRAIIKSVVTATDIEPHQIVHINISPVGKGLSLVMFNIYMKTMKIKQSL